jgi:hypothetical protein
VAEKHHGSSLWCSIVAMCRRGSGCSCRNPTSTASQRVAPLNQTQQAFGVVSSTPQVDLDIHILIQRSDRRNYVRLVFEHVCCNFKSMSSIQLLMIKTEKHTEGLDNRAGASNIVRVRLPLGEIHLLSRIVEAILTSWSTICAGLFKGELQDLRDLHLRRSTMTFRP